MVHFGNYDTKHFKVWNEDMILLTIALCCLGISFIALILIVITFGCFVLYIYPPKECVNKTMHNPWMQPIAQKAGSG